MKRLVGAMLVCFYSPRYRPILPSVTIHGHQGCRQGRQRQHLQADLLSAHAAIAAICSLAFAKADSFAAAPSAMPSARTMLTSDNPMKDNTPVR